MLSDVAWIKTHHKADAVVSLTDARELDVMLCSGLPQACAAQGMVRLPHHRHIIGRARVGLK